MHRINSVFICNFDFTLASLSLSDLCVKFILTLEKCLISCCLLPRTVEGRRVDILKSVDVHWSMPWWSCAYGSPTSRLLTAWWSCAYGSPTPRLLAACLVVVCLWIAHATTADCLPGGRVLMDRPPRCWTEIKETPPLARLQQVAWHSTVYSYANSAPLLDLKCRIINYYLLFAKEKWNRTIDLNFESKWKPWPITNIYHKN